MLLIGKVCVSKFWTFLHLCLRITGQMHIFRLYQDHACPLWPHVWVFFCFKRFISKDIKGKTCKISKGQANQIPIGHKIQQLNFSHSCEVLRYSSSNCIWVENYTYCNEAQVLIVCGVQKKISHIFFLFAACLIVYFPIKIDFLTLLYLSTCMDRPFLDLVHHK